MMRLCAVVSVAGVLAISGLGGAKGHGQDVPPPLPGPLMIPADLGQLGQQMAKAVQNLGEEIDTDLGATEDGRHLLDDTRELAQAVNEFQASLADRRDRFQARRAYSGIDVSWHHLLGRLSRPNSSTPAVDRAAQGVAQIDALIHRALGLNDAPAAYYGAAQAPSGVADLQRLSHALVDRSEAFVAVVRADFAGPGAGRLVRESVNLAQAADTFHDAIDLNGPVNDTTRNAFSAVDGLSDQVEADLAPAPANSRARVAWQAYKSVEVLIHQSLGLPNAPEELTNTVLVEQPAAGGSPVAALSDQLVQQVGAFVQVFSQTARAVPEGGLFLADAQALLAAATDFRQDVARGISPNQLAFEFRDVDAIWQRLARRTERIARGRTGPNIQQVGVMGQTVAEIHRLLGIPGYAPVVGPMP